MPASPPDDGTARIVELLNEISVRLTGAGADAQVTGSGLVQRLDRLVAALEAHTAVAAGLTATLARNAEGMFAVADSHARLLAALLAPEEPAPDSAPVDERDLMMRHGQVLGADGQPQA